VITDAVAQRLGLTCRRPRNSGPDIVASNIVAVVAQSCARRWLLAYELTSDLDTPR
jgi:hypothetical protein